MSQLFCASFCMDSAKCSIIALFNSGVVSELEKLNIRKNVKKYYIQDIKIKTTLLLNKFGRNHEVTVLQCLVFTERVGTIFTFSWCKILNFSNPPTCPSFREAVKIFYILSNDLYHLLYSYYCFPQQILCCF